MSYSNPENVPAIRAHTRNNPTTCPWCGDGRWFVSVTDDRRDNGRVEMYCDSPECHSRETQLIVTRGEGAHTRADVRALQMIDGGHHTNDRTAPPSVDMDVAKAYNLGDLNVHTAWQHNRDHLIEWRHSGSRFTIEPSALGDES